METARLDDIVRQKDPALKAVVEQLSRGDVRGGDPATRRPRVACTRSPTARNGSHAIAREYVEASGRARSSCRQTISRARRSTR